MEFKNPVKKFMRGHLHTIGEDISLSKAMEMMREFHVRHLPVKNRGELVGVLSDRDVKLALSVHPAASDLKVGDIMTDNVYRVSLEAPIEDVAREMANHKYGCAIVTNTEGQAVGIFTTTDALGALSKIVHSIS